MGTVFIRRPLQRHKMLLPALLATCCSCLALTKPQSYTSFKNFPVVGIEENNGEDSDLEMIHSENVPRAARQVDIATYDDSNLDDVFVEEAVFLTPEDREQRESKSLSAIIPQLNDFGYTDESLVEEENERPERDGAHGSHGSSRHSSNRNSRRFQQSQQVPQEQDFRQPAPPAQEQRGGRQTGQIGSALGVLSNPPSSNGDYNFNFSNDDGSSRQESGAPDGIRGSYSFITPEGEQVSVEYVADETGFHATGSHVPQAPPMPPHVQRLLDHLAKVNGLAKL